MDVQIPEIKQLTPEEEIYQLGLFELGKRLAQAKDNLKSINDQLESLQKSRLIWLDEIDRLSNLLSKVESK